MREPLILVSNFDDFFEDRPTGEFAKKCRKLSARTIHLTNPDDTVVLYEDISKEYRSYLEKIYGGLPQICFINDSTDALNLISSIENDTDLRNRLIEHSGRVMGLIEVKKVHWLGTRLGQKAGWTHPSHVRGGVVSQLNDKAAFQQDCDFCRLSRPESVLVKGIESLRHEGQRSITQYEQIMLRMTRSAGGLGNKRFSDHDQFRNWIDSLDASSPWCRQRILVEPFLNIERQFTSLLWLEPLAPVLKGHGERQILDGKESNGCVFPAQVSPSLKWKLNHHAMRLGALAWIRGYRGWLDIDWGMREDKTIVGFEINARFVATNIGYNIRRRLCFNKGVFISHDDIPCLNQLTLSQVLHHLNQCRLNWNTFKKEGVIITIEPHNGSFAAVILAQNHARLTKLNETFLQLVQECFTSSQP